MQTKPELMTRKQFEMASQRQRMRFIKSGGKLADADPTMPPPAPRPILPPGQMYRSDFERLPTPALKMNFFIKSNGRLVD